MTNSRRYLRKLAQYEAMTGNLERSEQLLEQTLSDGGSKSLPSLLILLLFQGKFERVVSLFVEHGQKCISQLQRFSSPNHRDWAVETLSKAVSSAFLGLSPAQQRKMEPELSSVSMPEEVKYRFEKNWMEHSRLEQVIRPVLPPAPARNESYTKVLGLLHKGNYKAAIEESELLALELTDIDFCALVAVCYFQAGNQDRAREILTLAAREQISFCEEVLPVIYLTEPLLKPILDVETWKEILSAPRSWARDRNRYLQHWQVYSSQGEMLKRPFVLQKSAEPIDSYQSKFGGRPTSIGAEEWPKTAAGESYSFLCQIRLDQASHFFPKSMLYVFILDAKQDVLKPSVQFLVKDLDQLEDVAFTDSNAVSGPSFLAEHFLELSELPEEFCDIYLDTVVSCEAKLGGFPVWTQGVPEDSVNFRLIFQMPAEDLPCTLPVGSDGNLYLVFREDSRQFELLCQWH